MQLSAALLTHPQPPASPLELAETQSGLTLVSSANVFARSNCEREYLLRAAHHGNVLLAYIYKRASYVKDQKALFNDWSALGQWI